VPRTSEALLRDVGRLLTRSHDLRETLDNVVRLVARWMHASACSIYVLEQDGDWLVLRSTRGLLPESVGRVRLRVGQGITGACLAARRPIAVPDVRQDARAVIFPESGEERFRSMLAVPLSVGELPVGVLTFQTLRPRVFKDEEVELLEMIAAQVGSIVLNARLLHQASQGGLPGSASRSPEPAPLHPPGTVLRGLPFSPGIAIGPIHAQAPVLNLEHLAYEPARTARAEWRAVRSALRETIRQLSDLRAAVGERFGEEFADVFTTHIMILEDQAFRSKLEERIEAHGDGVRALREVMEEYSELFGSLRDQTLRERASDIEDVAQRVTAELLGVRQHNPPLRDGVIVVGDRIAPAEFALLETEKIAGLVTAHGGATSHAAIFARSLEIPGVTGLADLAQRVRPSDEIVVDGVAGLVIVAPSAQQRATYEAYAQAYRETVARLDELRDLPSVTPDGVDIRLAANIGGLYDLEHVEDHGARGVGLFRSEVLVLAARAVPDEEEQEHLYRRVAERVYPEPVTVRCFDLGGDKQLPGIDLDEENPQLGWRAVRILLDRPELFRAQLRALVRANVRGNLRAMLPMVTTLEELEASRALLDEVRASLDDPPELPLGVMVETPAAVGLADHLARQVDFFSIGTNDLVQYTIAADRENERVADLYDPFHPAVLAQIARVSAAASEAGIPCSVCGELAANPAGAPLLVGMGIGELSMVPQALAAVRQMVRAVPAELASELAREVCVMARASDVRRRLARAYRELGLLEDPDLALIIGRTLQDADVDTQTGPG
jgi:phosphotransferase system enzyme I (PtsP)